MTAPDQDSTDPFYTETPPHILAKFAAIEAERKAQEAAHQASQPVQPANPGPSSDTSVKEHLRSIPMLDFYRANFPVKAERPLAPPRHLVSCFNSVFHSGGDKNPQLDINTDKNIYHCHACGVSGDMIDLLAVKYQRQDHNNRCPSEAVDQVIEFAASELLPGQTYRNVSGVLVFAARDNPEQFPVFQMGTNAAPNHAEFLAESAVSEQKTLVFGPDDSAEDADNFDYAHLAPTLDWKTALNPHGFVARYIEHCSKLDSPPEFHLYNAFLALGMTAGKKIHIAEARPVYANVFICDMGPSGAGKSGAASVLKGVLRQAFPYNPDTGMGVMLPATPASGETLVDTFRPAFTPMTPPGTPRNQRPVTIFHENITGMIEYGELSALMARTARQGNTLDATLMDLYDCDDNRPPSTQSRTFGNVVARGAFGSLITTSQPRRIAKLINKDQVDSGFINRFLFVFGKLGKRKAAPEALPPVTSVVLHLQEIGNWCQKMKNLKGGEVQWDAAAFAVYEEFFHKQLDKLEMSSAIHGRVNVMMKKHLLWLCLDEQSDMITLDIVNRAVTHFWPYMDACIRIVKGQMPEEIQLKTIGQKENELLNGVYRFKQKNSKWPTAAELRKHTLRGAHWSGQDIAKLLKSLVDLGELEVIAPQPGGRGKPMPRYMLAD